MNLKSHIHPWLKSILGALLFIVALFGVWYLSDEDNRYWLFHPHLPDGPQSSGASVPLPTMLAIAEREAAKIDPEAVLFGNVLIDPPMTEVRSAYTGPISGSLQLFFDYVRPGGGLFFIVMEDAAPEQTLWINTNWPNDSDSGRDIFRRYSLKNRESLSKAKISPRDVVQKTWEEAQQEAAKVNAEHMSLEPELSYDWIGNDYAGEWEVSYWLRPVGPIPDPSTSITTTVPVQGGAVVIRSTGSQLISFRLNPITGEITSRDYDLIPRPTPTP